MKCEIIILENEKENNKEDKQKFFEMIANNYHEYESFWPKESFLSVEINKFDKAFILVDSKRIIKKRNETYEEEYKILGYAILKCVFYSKEEKTQEFELLNFVINKKSRNCGYGNAFFSKIIEYFKKIKEENKINTVIYLEVDTFNNSAKKIYIKYGKYIQRRKKYYYIEKEKKYDDAEIYKIQI